MHDSSRCETCRGLPIGGSLSDADFSAFVGACRHELAAKQAVFQQRVQGGARWFYDMTDLSLTIDDIVLGMTPIGTYSSEYGSWLWAWANEDFPLTARRAAERIRTLHDITGFRVFLDPGIKASPADADDFVAHWPFTRWMRPPFFAVHHPDRRCTSPFMIYGPAPANPRNGSIVSAQWPRDDSNRQTLRYVQSWRMDFFVVQC